MLFSLVLALGANAQQQARLIDGTPEFADCLESASCRTSFFEFLSEAMLEQGYTFQHDPMATSALVRSRDGFVAGAMLTTFPLAAPRENLSGKEENTSFSPVYPRLFAGYTAEVAEGWRAGGGAFAFPPVPVQGASAFLLGADGSVARTEGAVRLGAEADVAWVLARAPVTATEEQFEDRDDFANPDNLDPETFAERCGSKPSGCVDTFRMVEGALRVGAAFPLPAGFAPYAKLGLAFVDERLRVDYDGTTWGVTGLQPNLHAGLSWEPGDHAQLAAGTSLAYKADPLAAGGPGAFFRLEGAAAWAF